MISLPRSPVIDRLCSGCIGTTWIQCSRRHRGTAKAYQLMKNWGKMKMFKKNIEKEEKQVLPFCFVAVFFFLFTKTADKVNDELQRGLRKYALICALFPSFLSLFMTSVHTSFREDLEHTARGRTKKHKRKTTKQQRQVFWIPVLLSTGGKMSRSIWIFLPLHPRSLFSLWVCQETYWCQRSHFYLHVFVHTHVHTVCAFYSPTASIREGDMRLACTGNEAPLVAVNTKCKETSNTIKGA